MGNPTVELKKARAGPNEDHWSFAKATTLGEKDQMEAKMDPYMITPFLDACMKLLRNQEAIQGL